MASQFQFGGFATRRPKVIAVVDDGLLVQLSPGQLRIVALLGTSGGGQPKLPVLYSSASQALAVVRSGDVALAIPRVFAPSSDVPGASLVYVVRVNPATQASKTLNDASATAALDLLSANWGVEDNQIAVKVESGTLASSKKISVLKNDLLYVKDNLQRNSFSILYTGAGSAATMTLSGTTLTTSITGGPGSEGLSLTLTDYPTVQALVNKIAEKSVYTVVVLTSNPTDPTVSAFDYVTAQSIKTSTYTVTATLAECIKWLNSGAQSLVTATRNSSGGQPPANTSGFAFLTGGTEGTTTATDWQAAIDALESKGVSYLVPLTSDAAIHAKVLTHVNALSKDGRQPRRAFVGAALGEKTSDLSNYLVRARALNSDRVHLLTEGEKAYNNAGLLVTVAPYFAAARAAGMASGVSIGSALTNKTMAIQGLEWTPTGAELEVMLENGIMPIEQVDTRGFFRITRSISTWLKNDAIHRVEFSTGAALDYTIQTVLAALEVFLGEKANDLLIHRMVSKVDGVLLDRIRDDIIAAYRNIVATLVGDTAKVEFECSPEAPLNFIGVTIHTNVVTSQLSLAVR